MYFLTSINMRLTFKDLNVYKSARLLKEIHIDINKIILKWIVVRIPLKRFAITSIVYVIDYDVDYLLFYNSLIKLLTFLSKLSDYENINESFAYKEK